jgi:hypothetical protein
MIDIRQHLIEKIHSLQDDAFRWGYDEKQARERPEYLHYAPNYKSTLWTLVLLADVKAPADLAKIQTSIRLITEHFYSPEHGVFRLPNMSHFPIPCLNGNMIYLHNYFQSSPSEVIEKTIGFFSVHQRFDDGDFKTPPTYPYCGNNSCYGRHTCFWGITKLLKGISFIPKGRRSADAQRLLENCIDFVLHHEVCYRSHRSGELLHRDIGLLTFPNFYKSDFLELLWLLARENVRDQRMSRALNLLRSKKKEDGFWQLEKPLNTIVPVGQKGSANAFITERAHEVLDFSGNDINLCGRISCA